MDSYNASHKVSCWKSVAEFEKVMELIFDEKSTEGDKLTAYEILKSWRIRRAQDTPLGVLCTITLLDVLTTKESNFENRRDFIALCEHSLMKFINFATSFKLNKNTMYNSARNLQLDSYLIDLRHNIAHGKQTLNPEVLVNSLEVCLQWIKGFYWDQEVKNIADVDINHLRYDAVLDEKLDSIFSFFDLLAELVQKNFRTFEQLKKSDETANDRWPTIKKYMTEKKLSNFQDALTHFKLLLIKTIESKNVRQNPRTFIHSLLTKCNHFMQVNDHSFQNLLKLDDMIIDEDEEEDIKIVAPVKNSKKKNFKHQSIVNIYQDIVWHIVRNDHLKLFIEMLLQIYTNKGEKQSRRQSARFWITIILKSYHYFQEYCQFTKSNAIDQTKITQDVRNVYSYQLDADLENVFIFVGTQVLPSYLKYSKDFLVDLLQHLDGDETEKEDVDMCLSFMPLVYPSLSAEQKESIHKLLDIRATSTRRNLKQTANGEAECEIHTVRDLVEKTVETNGHMDICHKEAIWQCEDSQICWSSLPIGYVFKV